MHSRAAVGVAVLLLGLSACTSDSTADDPGGATTSATSAPSPAGSTGPSSPTTSPTTAPATGPELVVKDLGPPLVRLRLPDGLDWRVRSGGDAASADYPGGGRIDVSAVTITAYPENDLDYYARITGDLSRSLGAVVERLDDRTVAGVEGFVLEARGDTFGYTFGAIYGGSLVNLSIDTPRDDARTREWVEAVLASAEWV
jgi:hypothetical protein